VADIDKILQGLQNTMAVMEELQRRQAARSQEHQNWLEDLTRGWTSHQASIRAHEESMRELEEKLNILDAGENASDPCLEVVSLLFGGEVFPGSSRVKLKKHY
jgi:hypothetical protein